MDEAVKSAAVPDQQNEASVEAEVIPEGASGASSANIVTMDDAVADSDITD